VWGISAESRSAIMRQVTYEQKVPTSPAR